MVEDLIRRARKRLLLQEAIAQAGFAGALTLGGFALLLIVGTQFMEWWALALLAAAGIGIGIARIRRRTPDPYATAVQIDDKAHLKDALSTAVYFSDKRSAGPAEFLSSLRTQAEAAAEKVRLKEAAPFVVPRSLYAAAALCVLASVLIAVRFGIEHQLDLRPPLTQFLIEDQAAAASKKAAAFGKSQNSLLKESQSLLSKLGMGSRPDDLSPGDEDGLEKAIDDALNTPTQTSSKAEKSAGLDKGDSQEGAQTDDMPEGDPLDNPDDAGKNQNAAEAKAGDKGSRASGRSTNPDKQENLLSRLKEAVSSMLSQSDQNSPQKGLQSKMKSPSDGSQTQSTKGDPQADNQAEAQGQADADGKNGMQTQGKMNARTGTQPAQGATGAGSEDGSKEIKEAEQLKAMGKISEIIGQRAATVSGETSVEVESGSQKLHTNYSQTNATHAETDSDVTRDEIPLALQAYVQRYFAQVRKTPAAKTREKTPAQ